MGSDAYLHDSLVGRYTAHDIAVFARESLTSNVRTLEPDDFPQVVMSAHEQWFIDFFAPVSRSIDHLT